MFLGLVSQGVTALQPLLHSKYDKHRGVTALKHYAFVHHVSI